MKDIGKLFVSLAFLGFSLAQEKDYSFVTKYYGSDSPCTYNQIIEAIDSKKTCEENLKKALNLFFLPYATST